MKTPQLRLHSRGVYYTRWWHGGRDQFVYFSRDRAESERAFQTWLTEVWAATTTGRDPQARRTGVRVVRVAELWLSHVQLTRGRARMVQYRSYITHFIDLAGEVPAAKIRPGDILLLAKDLATLRYSPATVHHCVKAAKRMLAWAGTHETEPGKTLIPSIDLGAVRLDRIPRPQPKGVSPEFVVQYLAAARETDPRLEPWLALGYLCLARPSEVHRLVHGQGRWLARNLFETRSKTQGTTGQFRYLVLTDKALEWLARATPAWQSVTSYTARARQVELSGHSGAKPMRSWGATELRRRGVSRGDIQIILGHAAHEPIDHYVEEDWDNLRRLLSRLALQPAAARAEEEDPPPPT